LYSYVENAPLNRVDADGHVALATATANNWIFPEECYEEELCFGTLEYTRYEREHDNGNAVDLAEAAEAQEQAGRAMSHLTPTPQGTKCDTVGIICEDGGKSIRVGDSNGEIYCSQGKCQKWNGDTNRWEDAPNRGNRLPNGILTTPQPQMSKFCEQLYNGHETFSRWSEQDAARGVATFFSVGPPEVFFGASAVEGGAALAEGIGFSVFCPPLKAN
jgi:hypothetical protein